MAAAVVDGRPAITDPEADEVADAISSAVRPVIGPDEFSVVTSEKLKTMVIVKFSIAETVRSLSIGLGMLYNALLRARQKAFSRTSSVQFDFDKREILISADHRKVVANTNGVRAGGRKRKMDVHWEDRPAKVRGGEEKKNGEPADALKVLATNLQGVFTPAAVSFRYLIEPNKQKPNQPIMFELRGYHTISRRDLEPLELLLKEQTMLDVRTEVDVVAGVIKMACCPPALPVFPPGIAAPGAAAAAAAASAVGAT
jgi:hypothetical protein